MTIDEARARFPVLERFAYLNAGTFGPLARATMDAVADAQVAELEQGRAGPEYFQRMLALRESVRAALNQEFADWSAEVANGDEVAFIPPVSGGRG